MNEAQAEQVRPSKKQRELLSYIEAFIGEHGYSPSYREIMAGCDYTSVATVSLHVNNLIKRGHLRKRDHSARSLEVVNAKDQPVSTNQVKPAEEKWLIEKIEHFFSEAELNSQNTAPTIDNLQILVAALQVLGLEGAVQSYTQRLAALRETIAPPEPA
jgi:repressor LexA